jgi:anti-anti-sigma factor
MKDVASVSRMGAVAVVRCHGDLDLSIVDELTGALVEAATGRPRGIVVDLSDVTFLDCRALRPLLDAAAASECAGGGFVLVGAGPIPRRILQVLQLADRLPQAPTLRAALEFAGTPAAVPALSAGGIASGRPAELPRAPRA